LRLGLIALASVLAHALGAGAALAEVDRGAPVPASAAGTVPVAQAMSESRPLTGMAARWLYRAPEPMSAAQAALVEVGQALYREGRRPDGSALAAERHLAGGAPVKLQGAPAACVNCHRASGLGTTEGDVLIPPITGHALYEPGSVATSMDTRNKRYLNTTHAAYDQDSLAMALREGKQPGGRILQDLMPRFSLNEHEVAALDAYLRTLSPTWSPGVTAHRVRLATVITPDVDPARRTVAINMVKALVSQKNLGTRPGRRHMVSAVEFVMRTERQWEHEIWELQGPKDTWLAQLREHQAAKPVFAIASGVVGDAGPLHTFCQTEAVPCWFPVAENLPQDAEKDFYGVYFSAGLGLEADVMALAVGSLVKRGPKRDPKRDRKLVQWLSDDDGARVAASRLEHQLTGLQYSRHVLPATERAQDRIETLARSMRNLAADDVLILWLRPHDMQLLDGLPAPTATVLLGTVLSGGEQAAVPERWRDHVQMVYPYALPEERAGHMANLKSWLYLQKLPLTDESLQSQLFFAFNYLNETQGDMLNNLHRDYLLERAEMMLGRREQQTANAQVLAQRGLRRIVLPAVEKAAREGAPTRDELTANREGTTIFPHLSLGPGQRMASKGAWLVRLSTDGKISAVESQAEWLTP
jgi:hypothetical protein